MHQCFRVNILTGLALIGVAAFLQTGQAADARKERNGESVYQNVCQYCHESGVGPKLMARQLPAGYSIQIVRSGRAAMPAFRPSEISDKELERVAAFIEKSKESTE